MRSRLNEQKMVPFELLLVTLLCLLPTVGGHKAILQSICPSHSLCSTAWYACIQLPLAGAYQSLCHTPHDSLLYHGNGFVCVFTNLLSKILQLLNKFSCPAFIFLKNTESTSCCSTDSLSRSQKFLTHVTGAGARCRLFLHVLMYCGLCVVTLECPAKKMNPS